MAVNWGIIGAGGIASRRTIPEGIMYKGEIEEFSECIERDLEPTISGEDGLWSQKVVLASYKSFSTGKVVRLKG